MITVIIPTMKKNQAYAELCVQSLLDTTNWDIIVSENGGSGEHNSYSWQDSPRVSILHNPAQGQCKAVNYAARQAKTDYLFISNDDMYYAPHWKDNLEFDYVCFSPNLIEPVDNAGSAPPFLKFDGGYTLQAFKQSEVDKYIEEFVTKSMVPIEETGFNFPVFIKRELWNLIGGYDESYDPWGSNSDTDLQTKIELAGVQPYRVRDVLVYHFSNKSGTFDGTHQDFWWRNWNYYKDKWGFTRDDEPLPDTWYARDMVNQGLNIYHPKWEGRYK